MHRCSNPIHPRRGALLSPFLLTLGAGCGADTAGNDRSRGVPGSGGNQTPTAGRGGAAPIVGGMVPGGGVAPTWMPPPSTGNSSGNTPMQDVSMREPVLVDACAAGNAAGLDTAQVDALKAGGDAAGMRWLYPYDGTVFPRGMIAPTLMWEGEGGSAVYLHIRSSLFDYHGCLVPTAPGRLQLPQDVWQQAGDQTTGPGDPFSIELTVLTGGAARGPIALQVVIAQATLKGSIFYNSYVGSGTSQPAAATGSSSTRSATTATRARCASCGARRSGSRPTAATRAIPATPPST